MLVEKLHAGFLTLVVGVMALLIGGVPDAYALKPVPLGTGQQCPHDIDNMPYGWETNSKKLGPEDVDWNSDGFYNSKDGSPANPDQVCIRLGATDGYQKMVSGEDLYSFGFVNITGVPENELVNYKFKAELPAPVIRVREGQELFLTMTNLNLWVRPDLDDPHTIHFHGYPNAAAVFEGVPELSMAIPGGFDFTYYYKLNDPGTYAYHCHVEPTEHIAMGMVGTLLVEPAMNNPTNPAFDGLLHAYNDTGGPLDTSYDREFVVHMHDLDSDKGYNLETVQEAANVWSHYKPNYFTLNGRSYPETLLPDNAPDMTNNAGVYSTDYISQPQSALIEANAGERVLIRLQNLTYQSHSITIPGMTMHVVGEDATMLVGPTGKDLSFRRTAYNIAGGEEADVIVDTTGLAPGTYFLYGRELYSHGALTRTDRMDGAGAENNHGLITEFRIN